MVLPRPSSSSKAQDTQQFLSTVLSQRGPSSLPYSEDVKWLIRQHLLTVSESYPSLQPKTAMFTHSDGRSVNLLQSDGAIPMVFQNVTYKIPVVIWLMETYPCHPPLVFVNPTRNPFVSPSGFVSIPYLQNWVYPGSNLVDLARNLSDYFGTDPPLYSLRSPNPNPNASFNASGSSGSTGGMQRNNSDSDRRQRAKGLIPSSQTPMQAMHKAERKYEVCKITDEEQAKQRQLKGILNKLTPQNFEKLFEQVKQVNIDNARTLSGVVSQIFDKALMEPTFCQVYANFCSRLTVELITFKRLLLNKCQDEFERGEREEEEANRTEEEGEAKHSEEEREEKRVKARRRRLGNIRLIGELYKKRMLTERIMHKCIKKLLGQYENPDEEDIEALCVLMSTIGEMIDHPKAKVHMDEYFDMTAKLSNNMKLSSRVRFMLKDVIDLRKNKWQQRRQVEDPKKIEAVHRDAAQERPAQMSRLARGPSPNVSVRRGQPMEFGPKGSNV